MLEVKLSISPEDAQALLDILNVYPSHPLKDDALMAHAAVLYAYTKLCYEQALMRSTDAF